MNRDRANFLASPAKRISNGNSCDLMMFRELLLEDCDLLFELVDTSGSLCGHLAKAFTPNECLKVSLTRGVDDPVVKDLVRLLCFHSIQESMSWLRPDINIAKRNGVDWLFKKLLQNDGCLGPLERALISLLSPDSARQAYARALNLSLNMLPQSKPIRVLQALIDSVFSGECEREDLVALAEDLLAGSIFAGDLANDRFAREVRTEQRAFQLLEICQKMSLVLEHSAQGVGERECGRLLYPRGALFQWLLQEENTETLAGALLLDMIRYGCVVESSESPGMAYFSVQTKQQICMYNQDYFPFSERSMLFFLRPFFMALHRLDLEKSTLSAKTKQEVAAYKQLSFDYDAPHAGMIFLNPAGEDPLHKPTSAVSFFNLHLQSKTLLYSRLEEIGCRDLFSGPCVSRMLLVSRYDVNSALQRLELLCNRHDACELRPDMEDMLRCQAVVYDPEVRLNSGLRVFFTVLNNFDHHTMGKSVADLQYFVMLVAGAESLEVQVEGLSMVYHMQEFSLGQVALDYVKRIGPFGLTGPVILNQVYVTSVIWWICRIGSVLVDKFFGGSRGYDRVYLEDCSLPADIIHPEMLPRYMGGERYVDIEQVIEGLKTEGARVSQYLTRRPTQAETDSLNRASKFT